MSTMPSGVLSGRRLSSCCRTMSTSSSCRRLSPTPRSLPAGLGAYTISITLCLFPPVLIFLVPCASSRTKKKDIYVISTPKRPVPLEHYLYAGKEIHKIIDKTGSFLGEGLKSAADSLRRKQEKEREAAGLPPLQRTGGRGLPPARGGRGGGPGRGGPPNGRGGGGAGRGAGPVSRGGRGGGGAGGAPFRFGGGGQDKNLWTHLVAYLKKKDLLPVVCFVFSKKRCEENAASLGTTDLCTSSEKSMVHVMIERALKRLKGEQCRCTPDRQSRADCTVFQDRTRCCLRSSG